MREGTYTDLDWGITCIDAEYGRPGMACFYLLERAGECAVVETGTAHSVPMLKYLLDRKGIDAQQVKYVIPTHVHLDHAGGAGQMMADFPQAQLVIHPKGAAHMVNPERLVGGAKQVYGEAVFNKLYGEVLAVEEQRILPAEDGLQLDLGDTTLEFRHTAGHADHHFCVWDEHSRGWFSGDMFGVSYANLRFDRGDYVIPATTPTQFRPEVFLESVALLQQYQPRALYLTHYGELPYSSEAAQLLCQQVTAYAEIARSLDVEDAELAGKLKLALQKLTAKCLAELAPAGEDKAYTAGLEFDIDLNVQGLVVYLQRLAKGSL